jgi:hypothetical protein
MLTYVVAESLVWLQSGLMLFACRLPCEYQWVCTYSTYSCSTGSPWSSSMHLMAEDEARTSACRPSDLAVD